MSQISFPDVEYGAQRKQIRTAHADRTLLPRSKGLALSRVLLNIGLAVLAGPQVEVL